MTELAELIAAEIAAQGPIPLDRYMDLALQHPRHGYYRQATPIGRAGDFITAPEISQMFGEMIGLWCAMTWQKMGSPAAFTLLELGPGRGTLMQDALRATRHVGGFHDALQLFMLENHPTLQRQQREAVAPLPVTHLRHLDDLPDLPLIVIANEFFDALPVKQYVRRAQDWHETRVQVTSEGFSFSYDSSVSGNGFPSVDVYETCTAARDIIGQIARHLRRYSGGSIIIDYGYEVPPGISTLQAVRAHQRVPFLSDPGQVDLTALVDFSALAKVAQTQGVQVDAIGGQGAFLRSMGIVMRAQQLKQKATSEQANAIDVALHRLTDDAEMGTLFRVMTLLMIL